MTTLLVKVYLFGEFHQLPISSLSVIFFFSWFCPYSLVRCSAWQHETQRPSTSFIPYSCIASVFNIQGSRAGPTAGEIRRLRSVEAAEGLVYWMGCDWSGFVRLLITCSLYLSTETPSCSFEHDTCRWSADAAWAVGKELEPAAGEGLESTAFLQGAKKFVTLDRALHKGPSGWGRMERVTRGCSWLSLS